MNSNKSEKGTLYLIPNTLGKTPENNTIPDYVLSVVRQLEVLIVENVQTTSRYLQWVGDTVPEYKIEFLLLNKETSVPEIRSFLKPLKKGKDAGLVSEAGCPAVADPGSQLIKMAHDQNIKVSPLVGPSSILLALMGSGFNGQQFSFHGYLPIDEDKRKAAIRKLESRAKSSGGTQIFMEAPHRNNEMKRDVIRYCRPETRFCTATNLSLPDEQIISKKISDWRKDAGSSIHKEPTIFLLYSS